MSLCVAPSHGRHGAQPYLVGRRGLPRAGLRGAGTGDMAVRRRRGSFARQAGVFRAVRCRAAGGGAVARFRRVGCAGRRASAREGLRAGGLGSAAVPRRLAESAGRRAPAGQAAPPVRRPPWSAVRSPLPRPYARPPAADEVAGGVGRGRQAHQSRPGPAGPVTCGRRCPGRRWTRGRPGEQVPTQRRTCSVSGAGGRSGRWRRARCSARSAGRAGPG
ncbi:hypothetical protein SAFG77S_00201 [Streptomyces afghaniensis]